MLGHQLWRYFHQENEVWVTLRKPVETYARFGLFDPCCALSPVSAGDPAALTSVFHQSNPEVVINCVGVIKQLKDAQSPMVSLKINALLPHMLAELCVIAGARLIHISTDCVFSGRTGGYKEADPSDAEDLYGRTKFLGEVHDRHCVTLRTSLIGRELETRNGLIEWFLSQNGKTVKGFRKAIYTGFITAELARIIELILLKYPDLYGLWQVSSDPISKYDLLKLVKKSFSMNVDIVPDDDFKCDRSLDSTAFRQKTNYTPPSWERMISELAGANS
jgi:dTDP-4-dehydrorhamnose reductase